MTNPTLQTLIATHQELEPTIRQVSDEFTEIIHRKDYLCKDTRNLELQLTNQQLNALLIQRDRLAQDVATHLRESLRVKKVHLCYQASGSSCPQIKTNKLC